MPQDVKFYFPVPSKISPHHDAALELNLSWLRKHRVLTSQEAVDTWLSWRATELVARFLPDASADDIALVTDMAAFIGGFDDQFESGLTADPAHMALVCTNMINILYGSGRKYDISPLTRMFVDVWSRCQQCMSPQWIARTAMHWVRYFAGHAQESIDQRARAILSADAYLAFRPRTVTAMEPTLDMIERCNHFELPPLVHHNRLIQHMISLICELSTICNDVYSVEKDLAHGEIYNMVIVIQHEKKCSFDDAVKAVQEMFAAKVDQFLAMKSEIPSLCVALSLTAEQTENVHRYIHGCEYWLRAELDWEQKTLRYQSTPSVQGNPSDLARREDHMNAKAANISQISKLVAMMTDRNARTDRYQEVIPAYYEIATDVYRHMWGESFHASYFHGQETLAEASANQERWLADQAGFGPGQRVLDVGCGIGNPALTVAEHSKTSITGITITPEQIAIAREKTQERGMTDLVDFVEGDYMKMTFADATFDAAYTFDATCHMPDKTAGYREVARVIKPGGVFIGFDWFCRDDISDEQYAEYIEPLCSICAIPNLISPSEFRGYLEAADFEDIHLTNMEELGDIGPFLDALAAAPLTVADDDPLTAALMTESVRVTTEAHRTGNFIIMYWKCTKKN